MNVPLTDEHARALTWQSYQRGPAIDGVRHEPLRKHRALEGSFMELLRVTGGQVEGLEGFELRQVSVSSAGPGRINAFHVHPKVVQDEVWTVLAGEMLVWLVDVRRDSPTAGVKRSFVLSGEQPAWLVIPSGVAHGYRAGAGGATLLYCMNSQFNIDDPNEGRLPWDHFGPELWEDDRG